MSAQGGGGFQVGQILAAIWKHQVDKTAPAITRGRFLAMDASQNWELATSAGGTHINKFAFTGLGAAVNDPKVSVVGELAYVVAEVPAAGTATPGKEAVISGTAGMIVDRNAEAANKVVGTIKGTPDMINSGVVAESAISGPNPVIVQIRPWGIV